MQPIARIVPANASIPYPHIERLCDVTPYVGKMLCIAPDETFGFFPAECVKCNAAIGPALKLDAECPGWVCEDCYAELTSEED